MQRQIGDVYQGMDLTLETFPGDDQVYERAYEDAIATFNPGDVAVIFTPDDTHYTIAKCCIDRGMHVMITKPIVQHLDHHRHLSLMAKEKNVLVGVEVHKRLDPFYADARDRARLTLGNFQYMYAYMSQPKHQLDTFKSWAGKSSDISFYLNSHHVDFSEWTLAGIARPVRVTATASNGVAMSKGIQTEDSITLTVQWRNKNDHTLGCAVYTSSWAAPKSDVHSQQRFFYMGSKGEIHVDQAHRGCTVAMDNKPFASVNPLYMKFTPTHGYFSGQFGYGVRSIENFIDACAACNGSLVNPDNFDDGSIATVHTTFQGTAILEAGRMSLDHDGQPVDILYESDESEDPIGLQLHNF
jgi:D-galacturonate reductase